MAQIPMPRTLFDKIWEAHRVAQRADGRELIYIDRHVLHGAIPSRSRLFDRATSLGD